MAQFLAVLYGDPSRWGKMPEEVLRTAYGKYMDWGVKGMQAGFVTGLHKLFDEPGKVIRGRKPVVTDGPFSETKEWMGGYYIVEAANYDQAVNLVLDHPHLGYDGVIEVRQVEPLPK